MSRTTPPFPEYEKWTTSRFFSFIRSALRKAWTRWPPRYEALAEARKECKEKVGNQKWTYQCNECKNWFKQKEVEVDHIEPAGTLRCFEDVGAFCSRLFVGSSKLRVLCKGCHKAITKADRGSSL